ncbi:MAG TPA: hypothetical protein VMP01_09050 [Pirellulaceae bacterium]|nr:hypothetical protein [Pirellulaceae bacterium]
MSTNPYQSPQVVSEPVSTYQQGSDREKLRRVAKYQKWVIYALLVNIVMNIALNGVAMSARQPGTAANLLILLAVLVVALVIAAITMVAVFMLANEVYSAASGVLCAILMLIPCVSLITLLVLNSRATSVLQQGGVKVGLMGANLNQI